MEPTNAVVFRDVSVRRSGLAILEHVNATVPQGSCTVIVGPNGAGKTTLILALIGEMRHDGTERKTLAARLCAATHQH